MSVGTKKLRKSYLKEAPTIIQNKLFLFTVIGVFKIKKILNIFIYNKVFSVIIIVFFIFKTVF